MRGLPNRRHFRFFYTPILPGNPAPFVLLDVVEESGIPHEVVKKLITPAILNDTLDAALLLSRHSLKGVKNTPEAEKMTEGVRKVSEHLINYRFNLNVAKVAAAKAALLSRLVLSEGQNDSLTYWRTLPTVAELSTLTIDGPWDRLQRLRSTSPEAFFYWQQAAKLQAILLTIGSRQ